MKLFSNNDNYKLYQGSMLDMLEVIEPETIDSIVTDPPYGLTSITKRFGKENSAECQYGKDGSFARLSKGFMGKEWDGSGIEYNIDTWKKCYEVLKPGGYLLAFGGSRTFHRIACAIEDAGFEIRDTIMWLYGSGFPKSMDISKQLDKNANSEMLGIIGKWLKQKREQCKLSREEVANIINLTPSAIYNWEENPKRYGFPTKDNWNKIKKIYKFDGTWDDFTKEAEREVIGTKKVMGKDNDIIYGKYKGGEVDITIPATDLAKQWQGWGTALKPSFEPIIVARKPFKGSLVDNVIEYGVGGINIDECRVGNEIIKGGTMPKMNSKSDGINIYNFGKKDAERLERPDSTGRFPANTILTYNETDFDEVCGGFPYTKSGGGDKSTKCGNTFLGTGYGGTNTNKYEANEGSASRYFYCAKASKKDRDEGLENIEATTDKAKGNGLDRICEYCGVSQLTPELCHCKTKSWITKPKKNTHPTVKPTELMQYLVRLVSPNGATILDPFNGSGSTGKAVMYENKERNKNYKYIGIELTEEYLPIAKARIEYVCNLSPEEKNLTIFDYL